jgi:hypothetical protein
VLADEIDLLREQGLAHPVHDIVASLQAHASVIPHEGVLGGRMGFYVADLIYVLDARTVFARFTDGHIEGSGVFQFTVLPDSTIAWTVLSSRIDGTPSMSDSARMSPPDSHRAG